MQFAGYMYPYQRQMPKRFVGPSISIREQAGHDFRSGTRENTHSAFPETLRTFSACETSRIVTSPLKVRLPSSLTRNNEPLGKSSSNYNDITAQWNGGWGKYTVSLQAVTDI